MFRFLRASSVLIVGLSALSLVSCAIAPQPFETTEIESVRRGKAAVIAAAFEGNDEFHASWLTLGNLDTNQLFELYVQDENATAAARTDSAVVPPGQYVLLAAEISSNVREGEVPMMRYWFAPFDVRGGDVLHLGTMRLDVIAHEALPESRLDRVGNLAKRLSTADRNRYVYPTIVATHDAKIAEDLAARAPDLSSELRKVELERRVDPDTFAQIIASAYAPGADGSTPSSEAARTEIDREMHSLFTGAAEPTVE